MTGATTTAQPPSQTETLAGVDRQIAAVEGEYKAQLTAAGERLLDAQARQRAAQTAGGAVSAPPELEDVAPEVAATLRQLETRLDQLKELRQWIVDDPALAALLGALRAEPPAAAAAMRVGIGGARRLPNPQPSLESPQPASTGFRRVLPVVIAALALLVGWLLSLALPATAVFGALLR